MLDPITQGQLQSAQSTMSPNESSAPLAGRGWCEMLEMLPGGLISTEHAAVPSREGKGGTQNFHKHGINEKPLEKF